MDVETVRDQFDLPRLEAFNKYTNQYPPQHMLVAAYFGYGKAEKAKQPANEDVMAMMAAFPEVKR